MPDSDPILTKFQKRLERDAGCPISRERASTALNRLVALVRIVLTEKHKRTKVNGRGKRD